MMHHVTKHSFKLGGARFIIEDEKSTILSYELK